MGAFRLRKPVVAFVALLFLALGLIAGYATLQKDSGPDSRLSIDLLVNKNDGKDNCPNDGNAGGGNDGRCQPPGGGYGSVGNPNDGKDNCPTDGNAGKGNDNKGPGGGCRS